MATNLRVLTFMILAAAAAPAQQWSITDTGGTVALGTDLTVAGATVASPAGTFSMSCPVTALPPGTYQAEWVCTGGTVTIQSNDGLTTVNGNLTSGTFIETASGGGRGHPTTYYYVFTGSFTGAISLSGQAQAITGSTVQSLAGSTSQLGTGMIASGSTFVNTEYEPVYVADTGNNRIVRMDDMTGANWTTFGKTGTGTNQFQNPYGIFVNAAGRIYVTDNINCRVVRIDNMSGKNWTTFGTCGSGNLQFNNPTGLFVDSAGKIYVTDTGNNRIVRVNDMAGDGWVAYGGAGSGTGQFASPVGVAVDSAGKIYISDTNNARIVRMDNMSGTNWTTFSGVISGVDQLGAPVAISLDGAGRIYVLDWYFAHVMRTDDHVGHQLYNDGHVRRGSRAVHQPLWLVCRLVRDDLRGGFTRQPHRAVRRHVCGCLDHLRDMLHRRRAVWPSDGRVCASPQDADPGRNDLDRQLVIQRHGGGHGQRFPKRNAEQHWHRAADDYRHRPQRRLFPDEHLSEHAACGTELHRERDIRSDCAGDPDWIGRFQFRRCRREECASERHRNAGGGFSHGAEFWERAGGRPGRVDDSYGFESRRFRGGHRQCYAQGGGGVPSEQCVSGNAGGGRELWRHGEVLPAVRRVLHRDFDHHGWFRHGAEDSDYRNRRQQLRAGIKRGAPLHATRSVGGASGFVLVGQPEVIGSLNRYRYATIMPSSGELVDLLGMAVGRDLHK